MNKDFLPSEEENQLATDLEQLLDFGYEQAKKVSIPDTGKDMRLTTLFQMMGVVHHFTKGILLVAKQGLPEVGIVLLRSVLEANITTQYILLEKSDLRAISFYLDDEKDRKRWVKNFLEFYNKYPDYGSRFSPRSKLEELFNNLDANIQQIESRYGELNFPDLFARAIAIDKQRGKPDNEFMYRTIYRFFSHFSYLSSRGLNNFLKVDTTGIKFQIDPHSEGNDRLLISAYGLYLGFIETFIQEFGLNLVSESKPFQEKFQEMLKL